MSRLCDIVRKKNTIERYEKNPSFCINCGVKIELRDGLCSSDAKKRKYCSSSCAAICNNTKNPKRIKDIKKTTCPLCGKKMSHGAKVCHHCKRKNSLDRVWASPIKDYYNNGASRTKYSAIRTWAGIYMTDFDSREKKCEVCGFSSVVEVSHKKAIRSFPDDSLMGEVNSRENLMWLCPNHHAEFDKGILCL